MRYILSILAALWASGATAQEQPDWVAAFLHDVSACWNVTQADDPWPIVTVGFSMRPDGQPVMDSFTLIDAGDASDLATQAAFSSVRRAVIRCSGDGYDLPPADYGLWDEIEMSFDPRTVGLP